jgi:hypothetical protein
VMLTCGPITLQLPHEHPDIGLTRHRQ